MRNIVFLRGMELGVADSVITCLVLLAPYCLATGYVLRFSLRAAEPQSVNAIVRHNASPWESLGVSASVTADTTRADYIFPFVATGTAAGRFDISSSVDFAFFLDDVDLREANIFQNDPADDAQILVNSTDAEQNVDLGEDTYCDLDGQEVSGEATVPAFSSRILLSCKCNNDSVCNNHETTESCARDCP